MSNLKKYKLSEIAYIKMGQSPDGESCNEDGVGIPLLNGPSEFTDFYPIPKQFTINAKRFSEEGEILFCVRGSTTGRMNWSNGTYAIGRGLASITHKEGKQLNHFLKYLIHSNLDSILKAANGSTFPNLTSDIFASFELAVPDLPTQQKIASVLSSLDAKIELNNRINAELEAMAKTLYDYWFVQFDFPDAEGKPYKSSGGEMVWNEGLKREIPQGWELRKLRELSEMNRGVTYGKNDIKKANDDGVIPILRATNINDSKIDLDDMVYVPKKLVSETQRLNKFEILITMSSGSKAHLGKNALFYFDREVSFGAFCSKLTVKDRFQFYVYNFISSDGFKRYISNMSLGTSINNLTNDHINNCSIIIPAENISNNFERMVASLYQKISINSKENQQLAQLRDWLLPMLMNGQVVVE